MLKVKCLVSDFFQLVLKVVSKFSLDIVIKGLKIFKVDLKKSFKIRSYNKNGAFLAIFVLGPLDTYAVIEK